jgi:opacity protein-like surface antigen
MNKSIVLAAVCFALSAASASAGDFDKIENNIRLETAGFGLSTKLDINDPSREFGVDYTTNGVTVGYTRAEGATDAADESRFIVAYTQSFGPVYAGVRAEWRDLAANGDDHLRIIPTVGVKHDVPNTKVALFADVSPKFLAYKNGVGVEEISETDWRIGAKYAVTDSVSAGPFLQYVTDKDWNKTDTFIGTAVTVKF